MLIVRSPVRISFGGGGTDLPSYYEKYGGGVLSTAINKYFYTVLTRRDDSRIQVISSDLQATVTTGNIAAMELRGRDLEIPLAVLQELGLDVGVDLFLASEIPPGTGLGSSASVCVNILKALTTYKRTPCSKFELAERAFHIARHVLGKPVGKQDEYAAAFGGLNYIRFEKDGGVTVEPLAISPPVLTELQSSLLLFFTGAARNSWSILQEQEQSTRQASSSVVDSLQDVYRFGLQMREALLQGDLARFATLLDLAWQAKKRVSTRISNSRIDALYQIARDHGALGGKITGAGGGGFLLLFCPFERQADLRARLAQEGLAELTFTFDFQGTSVVVNDPFLDGDGRCGLRWSFVPHVSRDAS
jgi:D-glycero-alpha-D-manno-heptose-7-phosphate kinase